MAHGAPGLAALDPGAPPRLACAAHPAASAALSTAATTGFFTTPFRLGRQPDVRRTSGFGCVGDTVAGMADLGGDWTRCAELGDGLERAPLDVVERLARRVDSRSEAQHLRRPGAWGEQPVAKHPPAARGAVERDADAAVVPDDASPPA